MSFCIFIFTRFAWDILILSLSQFPFMFDLMFYDRKKNIYKNDINISSYIDKDKYIKINLSLE